MRKVEYIGGAKGDRTPDLMTASPGRPSIKQLRAVMITNFTTS